MTKPDPASGPEGPTPRRAAVHESLNATIHRIKEARGELLRDCPVCGRGRHLCDVAQGEESEFMRDALDARIARMKHFEGLTPRRGGGEASHFEGMGE